MSTCARCGRQQSDIWPGTSGVNPAVCYVAVSKGTGEHDWTELACRDRELANLRSLLRSVTGKLEEAGGALERIRDGLDGSDQIQWDLQQEADLALRDIWSVLEALS
jgi:hypothetical protein